MSPAHRETDAQLVAERHRRGIGVRDRRRNSNATVARKSSPACMRADRLDSRTWCLSPPSRKDAPRTNNVGDNRAGDRRLHHRVLARAKGGQRDDQFRKVAERGIQQAADRIAGFGGDGHGGNAEQHCQRHDGQHGQHEEQRVRLVRELFR